MNNTKSYKLPRKKERRRNVSPTPLRFLSPIHKATRQLSIHLQRIHAGLGVSHPETHVLAYLLSYGPCSVGELLNVFGHKKSTLTSILDRLAKRGHIVRDVNPLDRRSFMIDLTAPGRRTARKIRRLLENLEEEIASRISQRSLAGFRHVMEAIANVTVVEMRHDDTPPGKTERHGA